MGAPGDRPGFADQGGENRRWRVNFLDPVASEQGSFRLVPVRDPWSDRASARKWTAEAYRRARLPLNGFRGNRRQGGGIPRQAVLMLAAALAASPPLADRPARPRLMSRRGIRDPGRRSGHADRAWVDARKFVCGRKKTKPNGILIGLPPGVIEAHEDDLVLVAESDVGDLLYALYTRTQRSRHRDELELLIELIRELCTTVKEGGEATVAVTATLADYLGAWTDFLERLSEARFADRAETLTDPGFRRRHELARTLEAWRDSPARTPKLVTGSSRSGKSQLLREFTENCRAQTSRNQVFFFDASRADLKALRECLEDDAHITDRFVERDAGGAELSELLHSFDFVVLDHVERDGEIFKLVEEYARGPETATRFLVALRGPRPSDPQVGRFSSLDIGSAEDLRRHLESSDDQAGLWAEPVLLDAAGTKRREQGQLLIAEAFARHYGSAEPQTLHPDYLAREGHRHLLHEVSKGALPIEVACTSLTNPGWLEHTWRSSPELLREAMVALTGMADRHSPDPALRIASRLVEAIDQAEHLCGHSPWAAIHNAASTEAAPQSDLEALRHRALDALSAAAGKNGPDFAVLRFHSEAQADSHSEAPLGLAGITPTLLLLRDGDRAVVLGRSTTGSGPLVKLLDFERRRVDDLPGGEGSTSIALLDTDRLLLGSPAGVSCLELNSPRRKTEAWRPDSSLMPVAICPMGGNDAAVLFSDRSERGVVTILSFGQREATVVSTAALPPGTYLRLQHLQGSLLASGMADVVRIDLDLAADPVMTPLPLTVDGEEGGGMLAVQGLSLAGRGGSVYATTARGLYELTAEGPRPALEGRGYLDVVAIDERHILVSRRESLEIVDMESREAPPLKVKAHNATLLADPGMSGAAAFDGDGVVHIFDGQVRSCHRRLGLAPEGTRSIAAVSDEGFIALSRDGATRCSAIDSDAAGFGPRLDAVAIIDGAQALAATVAGSKLQVNGEADLKINRGPPVQTVAVTDTGWLLAKTPEGIWAVETRRGSIDERLIGRSSSTVTAIAADADVGWAVEHCRQADSRDTHRLLRCERDRWLPTGVEFASRIDLLAVDGDRLAAVTSSADIFEKRAESRLYLTSMKAPTVELPLEFACTAIAWTQAGLVLGDILGNLRLLPVEEDFTGVVDIFPPPFLHTRDNQVRRIEPFGPGMMLVQTSTNLFLISGEEILGRLAGSVIDFDVRRDPDSATWTLCWAEERRTQWRRIHLNPVISTRFSTRPAEHGISSSMT